MDPSSRTATNGAALPGNESIDAFLRTCRTINDFRQQDQLLNTIAKLIPKTVSASGGTVLLWNQQTDTLAVEAAWFENPVHEARFKTEVTPQGDCVVSRVFETGAPLITNNCAGTQDIARHDEGGASYWIQSRLDVPLKIHGRKVGVLSAINKNGEDFHPADLDLLLSIAGIAALALENIRIRESLAGYYRQMKDFNRAKDNVIHHLSHALKTPLAVGMASLKLLRKQLKRLPETDWSDIYERVQRNLTRLLTIEYEMEDILRQRQDDDHMFDPLTTAADGSWPSRSDEPKRSPGESDLNGGKK